MATRLGAAGGVAVVLLARTALAEALIKVSPGMKYAIFTPGGGEAVDVALKSARYGTKKRKIVSIIKGYHGHTGLAVGTGDERFSKIFLSDRPDEFIHVPFNDLNGAFEPLPQKRQIAERSHPPWNPPLLELLWNVYEAGLCARAL